MPSSKAAEVLALPCSRRVDVAHTLLDGFQAHALNVLRDTDRDIDAITLHPEPGGGLFVGTYRGTRRFLVGLLVNKAEAEVLVKATKGPRTVDVTDFGVTGLTVGNSLLIAVAYHVAIFALRASGIVAIVNDPYDARLQLKYELMGFHNGKRLPLDDVSALEKAFRYVEQIYATYGLTIRRAPLPL